MGSAKKEDEGCERGNETTSGYAGFTHGSITDSRWVEVSRSNPRHQRSNISIFWYRINGSLPRTRRRHKFSADLSCITDRQKDPLWLYGSMAIVRGVSRVPFFHAFASYGLVIRSFSHGHSNESIILIVRYTALPSCSGSFAFWSILKTSELHSKEFNFCRITKHVNCIMLIVLTPSYWAFLFI